MSKQPSPTQTNGPHGQGWPDRLKYPGTLWHSFWIGSGLTALVLILVGLAWWSYQDDDPTHWTVWLITGNMPLWAGLMGMLLGLAVLALCIGYLRAQERKQWVLEGVQRDRHLRAMLDAAPNGMLAIDTNGIIVMVNNQMQRLFGWSRQEMLGQPIEMLLPERYRGKHLMLRHTFLQAPTPRAMGAGRDLFGLRKDGQEFPVEIGLNPTDPDSVIGLQIVASVVDITERKQAEAELRAGRDRIKNIFNAAPNGMLAIDKNGAIVMVNTQMERLFGWAQEEMLGKSIEMLLPERYRGKHIMLRNNYLQTPQPRAMGVGRDLFGLRKDGHEFPVEIGLNPTGPDSNIDMQVVASVVDITERKQAEAMLNEANNLLEKRIAERTMQLEAANRAKSDFLANMSHELRTPLNAIIGFSEMFKDGALGPLDERQRGFSADIYEAGKHLLSLINDILDLSKVEAGMLQLQLSAVNLLQLFQSSTLMVREKALNHAIELSTHIDQSIGTALCDERKVKQIIYNLLANAIKFTEHGGTVSLRIERCTRADITLNPALPGRLLELPTSDNQAFLHIAIEDNGIGIAPEDLPKLFEPFVQVDSSAARLQSGTGLGLSLVRRLAELHGGTVGVSSRLGMGSCFQVWLPYCEVAHTEAQEEDTEHLLDSPALTVTSNTSLQPPLALVIEDDEDAARLIAGQLQMDGFEVICAVTAEEGLVRAERRPPDLITLDIFLPLMNGFDFMRKLKASPKLKNTPVVLITASKEMDHGLALGARRVLHKPFSRAQLRSALSGLVVSPQPGTPKVRILIVDDNPKLVEFLATLLEAEGYGVTRTYGGAEAIHAVSVEVPDLMILDLMMPEVNGFEVALAMRQKPNSVHMPILVLTAMELSEEDRARLKLSVDSIMEKTHFNNAELLAEVRRALPKRNDR
ncbi:PAS domain S-box protein [Limnohabitans sp. JirII-31]|uniref:PAS domain S-box protein n=1 Tax=Limnohabitans sp. JirII-31 TaxID=1977908 RepID=UPI000C1E74BE|nr:PAS domain S-box protein [Limnohabitans sp. JirII-31]PIT73872.1 hypothetical protein B9Z41_14375 [Limnohabitans sp. JirII-31]